MTQTIVIERLSGMWAVGAAYSPVIPTPTGTIHPAREYLTAVPDEHWLNTPEPGDFVKTINGGPKVMFEAVK